MKGHSFWDTEIWMYPPILVLYPDLAKLLLEYRWRRMDVAKDYATETGWSGVRWVKTRTKEGSTNFKVHLNLKFINLQNLNDF